jgi:hypothetical protein
VVAIIVKYIILREDKNKAVTIQRDVNTDEHIDEVLLVQVIPNTENPNETNTKRILEEMKEQFSFSMDE